MLKPVHFGLREQTASARIEVGTIRVSTGRNGRRNDAIFLVSRFGQRNGRRAFIPFANRPSRPIEQLSCGSFNNKSFRTVCIARQTAVVRWRQPKWFDLETIFGARITAMPREPPASYRSRLEL
jgi:hypothetical protein